MFTELRPNSKFCESNQATCTSSKQSMVTQYLFQSHNSAVLVNSIEDLQRQAEQLRSSATVVYSEGSFRKTFLRCLLFDYYSSHRKCDYDGRSCHLWNCRGFLIMDSRFVGSGTAGEAFKLPTCTSATKGGDRAGFMLLVVGSP